MVSDGPTIVLHIGAMKTGTTYVQQVLKANQEQLAAAGVQLPPDTGTRVRAVQDVLRLTGRDPLIRAEAAGAWAALSEQMLAHPGRSVLSMEFLSHARPAGARRVMRSLAAAEVHVVLSVRDAQTRIPAMWQTIVHSGGRMSWPSYLAAGRRAQRPFPRLRPPWPNLARRSFQRGHDIARMLDVWASVVPPERLHVVTVPSGSVPADELWRRMAAAMGLQPELCTAPAARSNPSLGFGSTELLRRVNFRLRDVPRSSYLATVERYLGFRVLGERRAVESRARLDEPTRQAAVAGNARTRGAITASGADLVGDLDDLPLTPGEPDGEFRPMPADDEVLGAAADAVTGLERLIQRRIRRRRSLGQVVPDPAPPMDVTSWAAAARPVDAAADDVARLCRVAVEHRTELRRVLPARPTAAQRMRAPSGR